MSVASPTRFARLAPAALLAVAACAGQPAPGTGLGDDASDSVYVGGRDVISSPDTVPGDGFGSVLALDGDTALVGVSGRGLVYVYQRGPNGWEQRSTIETDDVETADVFGYAVALSGDTALIAAWDEDTKISSVHVFARTGEDWIPQGTLTSPDAAPDDAFGTALALDGDTAVVGAWKTNRQSGAAYVYSRAGSEWTLAAKLTASDEAGQAEKFGSAVDIEGDTIVVGAPEDYYYYTFIGTAYVFDRTEDGWKEVAHLFADDGQGSDQFGIDVAVSGDTFLIGARGSNEYEGAAYVFSRAADEWRQEAKLRPSDAGKREDEPDEPEYDGKDLFGESVELVGDVALIGASLDDDTGPDAGAAYVYLRSEGSWAQQQKVTVDNPISGEHFGTVVELSGSTALFGSYPVYFHEPGKGRVYVMPMGRDRDDDDVTDVADNCELADNADQADLDGDGTGDACDDDDDADGRPDAGDNCPETPNADQKNHDGDPLGDTCDDDDDDDGVADDDDNCIHVANTMQTDDDGNGVGDACEDADGDGVSALTDNCPEDPNPGQEDDDGNGVGNVCDDLDADGVLGVADNCPGDTNADQHDLDGDGLGDACDSDFDGDGVLNDDDICPRTPNPGQDDLCHTPYGCATVSPAGLAPLILVALLLLALPRRRKRRC